MAHKIKITVEITKSAARTIEVTDAQYSELNADSPEDVLGQDLFDELWDEADGQHNSINYDYQIVDDEDRVLFDWDW